MPSRATVRPSAEYTGSQAVRLSTDVTFGYSPTGSATVLTNPPVSSLKLGAAADTAFSLRNVPTLSPDSRNADEVPPIPKNRLSGKSGFIAMSPTDRLGNWSVSGVQVGLVAVALAVRHTPPFTPPANAMFGLVGWGVMASTAPVRWEKLLFGVAPASWVPASTVGAGPDGSQVGTPSWMMAGASRSSIRSTRSARPRAAVSNGRYPVPLRPAPIAPSHGCTLQAASAGRRPFRPCARNPRTPAQVAASSGPSRPA